LERPIYFDPVSFSRDVPAVAVLTENANHRAIPRYALELYTGSARRQRIRGETTRDLQRLRNSGL